jgi:hypothetical protein
MCLTLYMAAGAEIAAVQMPELRLEPPKPGLERVRTWFSLPYVWFVGAHTGCNCGFPHVLAEEPIEYYEGLFAGVSPRSRQDDLASLRALFLVIQDLLPRGGLVEMLPIWNDDASATPKGMVELSFASLHPETFIFTEGFLYRLRT